MGKALKPKNTYIMSILGFTLLLALLILAIYFIISELKYYGLDKKIFGRFWNFRWWLIGHVSGGILALLIGPFQFVRALRNNYIRVHRFLGRIYLWAILIGATCATYLAWTSALAIHWTWATSLQVLGIVWFGTALIAYRAILNKNFQNHREWMIRSYTVTFSFVTFRWIVDLPVVVELGSFVQRAPTITWMSWVIPLLTIEMILQWNKNSSVKGQF